MLDAALPYINLNISDVAKYNLETPLIATK